MEKQLKTITIKGSDYVQVNERVLVYREEHPLWTIKTDILSDDGKKVVMKSYILDENGRIIATGIAHEVLGIGVVNGTSHYENCETSAVGRALGFLGIGISKSICSKEEKNDAIAKEKERENLIKAINGLKNSLNMTTKDFAEDLKKLEVEDLNQLDNGQLMTYFKILNKRKNA